MLNRKLLSVSIIVLLCLAVSMLAKPAFACYPPRPTVPSVCGFGKLTVEECHYTGDQCCFAVWAKCLESEPGSSRVNWTGYFIFYDSTAKILIIMKIAEGQFATLSDGEALRLFSGKFGGEGYTTVYLNGVKLGSQYYAHVNLFPNYMGNIGEQYIQLYVQVPELEGGIYFMGGHPTQGGFVIYQ